MLNLITGPGASVGNALVESPQVQGISFTGSTEIGTDLYARGAGLLKKVQCEMGGKNAVILLADADLDKAVGGIVQGAFGSTGQRCTATSRAIVESPIHDRFLDQLLDRTAQLKIGDGLDPEVDVSPLSSQYQQDKVLEYIGIGAEEGANLAHGGHALTGGIYDQGYYVEPTIFTGVGRDMRIAKEEIFGPVLTVFQAADLEDAVDISNSVQFGLSSSVYTRDLHRGAPIHQHGGDGYGSRQRAHPGRGGTPALWRHEVVGGGPAGAGHRGGGLLHRSHHRLHRLRRHQPQPGAVYLGRGLGFSRQRLRLPQVIGGGADVLD